MDQIPQQTDDYTCHWAVGKGADKLRQVRKIKFYKAGNDRDGNFNVLQYNAYCGQHCRACDYSDFFVFHFFSFLGKREAPTRLCQGANALTGG